MIIHEVYSQYFNNLGYLLNPKCLCSYVGRTEIKYLYLFCLFTINPEHLPNIVNLTEANEKILVCYKGWYVIGKNDQFQFLIVNSDSFNG